MKAQSYSRILAASLFLSGCKTDNVKVSAPLENDLNDLIEKVSSGYFVARRKFMSNLRPAKKQDYISWLKGYLARGGKNIRLNSALFERDANEFFVAKNDFELFPLHGVDAINLIVPKNINIVGIDSFEQKNLKRLGHSILYLEDGYRVIEDASYPSIPLYKDLQYLLDKD